MSASFPSAVFCYTGKEGREKESGLASDGPWPCPAPAVPGPSSASAPSEGDGALEMDCPLARTSRSQKASQSSSSGSWQDVVCAKCNGQCRCIPCIRGGTESYEIGGRNAPLVQPPFPAPSAPSVATGSKQDGVRLPSSVMVCFIGDKEEVQGGTCELGSPLARPSRAQKASQSSSSGSWQLIDIPEVLSPLDEDTASPGDCICPAADEQREGGLSDTVHTCHIGAEGHVKRDCI